MSYARVSNAPPAHSPYGSGTAASSAASLALRRDSPGSSLLGHGSPSAMSDSPYGSTQHLRRRSLGHSGLGDSFSDESSSAAGYAGAAVPLDGKDGYSKMAEPDDELHNPRNADAHSNAINLRGLLNVLTLALIGGGLLTLFMGECSGGCVCFTS
jgi:hypothetical protein